MSGYRGVEASMAVACPTVRAMKLHDWARAAGAKAAAAGSPPSDPPEDRLRKSALVISSLVITLVSCIWVVTYAALGFWVSALIPFLYQVASLAGLAFFAP